MDSRIEKKQTKDEVIYGIRKFKNKNLVIKAMDGLYEAGSYIESMNCSYSVGKCAAVGEKAFMESLAYRVANAYAWNKSGEIDDEHYKLMLGLDNDVTSYLFSFNFVVYNQRNKTYYTNRVEVSDGDWVGYVMEQKLDENEWKIFDELWAMYNVEKNIKSLIAEMDTFTKEVYGDKEIDGFFPVRFMERMNDDAPKQVEEVIDEYGYSTVTLVNDEGEEKTEYIHEIVAKMFLPNPNNLPYVRHKDGNKQNNSADNLEWTDIKPEYVKD